MIQNIKSRKTFIYLFNACKILIYSDLCLFINLLNLIMKTKTFDDMRDALVTSLLVIIGKFYGEDLDIGQGMELASQLAYKVDNMSRKFIREAEEAEKNSIEARIKGNK